MEHFYQQSFHKIVGAADSGILKKGEYEDCDFTNCDLSQFNLTDYVFLNSRFRDCNLSLVKLNNTAFREVTFKDCKLLGAPFYHCNDFGLAIQFNNCWLENASFFKLKLKQVRFESCKLHEVDFSDCDLSGNYFNHCDLLNAKFEHTLLEKTDFRTAFNYTLDPALNRVKKAKFSIAGAVGLLAKYDIIIEG